MKHQIQQIYRQKKGDISFRLKEFRSIWAQGSEEDIFGELAFCLLTPQTKAKTCWAAIERLKSKGILFRGNALQIRQLLFDIRFMNNKAKYIENARTLFTNNNGISIKPSISQFGKDIPKCREWLVNNVKGIGYKEASHFLRNIGFGDKIAILDRHILRNLVLLGVIDDMPKTLSKPNYLKIEKDMAELSRDINIPFSHLDLLLWYKETGEIFK
jgi:N-glycosylase/DNA lyase